MNDNLPKFINQRIKQLRKALNFSQAKFERSICVSNGYLTTIENEKREVPIRIIKLICSIHGASERWLMTGEGEMFVNTSADSKLEKMNRLFNELPPKYQDYIINQIEGLLEAQKSMEREARGSKE